MSNQKDNENQLSKQKEDQLKRAYQHPFEVYEQR